MNYAKWVVTQTSNPYLPDISWIAEFTAEEGPAKGKPFFITPVELLDFFKPEMVKQIKDPVILTALFLKKGSTAFLTGDLWAEERKKVFRRLRNELGIKAETQGEAWVQIEKFYKKNQSHKFAKTLQKIQTVGGSSCFGDLHTGNMMWRAKTQSIVITDPLAGEHTA
jgi:hypothetical protein